MDIQEKGSVAILVCSLFLFCSQTLAVKKVDGFFDDYISETSTSTPPILNNPKKLSGCIQIKEKDSARNVKEELCYTDSRLTEIMGKVKDKNKDKSKLSLVYSSAPRIPLTSTSVTQIMEANEPLAEAGLQGHVDALTWYIDNSELSSYNSYIQYIDATNSYSRASQVLSGLTNILNSVAGGGLQYRLLCHPNIDAFLGNNPDGSPPRYAWVRQNEYPWINHCRQFEDNLLNKPGWHYHEVSHLYAPRGMGTLDHTYDDEVCIQYAINNPSLSANTAACVTYLLNTDPPNVNPVIIPPLMPLLFE